MRKISIVGAGQSGLLLAVALKRNGFNVTLISNKTPDDILNSSVMSSQGVFHSSLKIEKELGLNFWENVCPKNLTVSFSMANVVNRRKDLHWCGFLKGFSQAVDQRIKFSTWMSEFVSLGGKLIIADIDLAKLDELANASDLLIVATGKGKIADFSFERDNARSFFSKPMRSLSLLYVKGLKPNKYPGINVNIIPEVGEYFVMPGLSINGPCEMMLFEGIIDGPLDCWKNIRNASSQLTRATEILNDYLPWEAERCKHIELAEDKGSLIGRYTPEIKNPIVKLPSGKYVLGIGDAIILNDPIAGQGANNAIKGANIYLQRILQNPKNYDFLWMKDTFDLYWKSVQWSTMWSNMLLLPPTDAMTTILKQASANEQLANLLANSFDNLDLIFPWILSLKDTNNFISSYVNEKTNLLRGKSFGFVS